MDSCSYSIPASMLRQYCFCRRIPFFALMKGLRPKAGIWVKQGLSYHDKVGMLSRRRNLSRFGIEGKFKLETDVHLKSEVLRIHGICDGVLKLDDNGEQVPLEFKLQESLFTNRGARIQLCAYALMLEESTGREIVRGFILYGSKGRALEVKTDKKARDEVRRVSERIAEDCEAALLPPSCATERQCCQCEFQNWCNDRF